MGAARRRNSREGRQGFVVCPAIEPGQVEEADAEALERRRADPAASPRSTETLARLRTHPSLAGRRIEPLHGRMSGDEKDRTMRAFAAGDIDVLVATTVIEVGVDVPNASTMVVLDADRFGVVAAAPAARARRPRRRAGHRAVRDARRAGHARARAGRGGRRDPRRLRARPGRPRAAPRGRRARRHPVGRALVAEAAARRRGRATSSPTPATAAEALLEADPTLAEHDRRCAQRSPGGSTTPNARSSARA